MLYDPPDDAISLPAGLPDDGPDQDRLYGAVPPLTVTLADPLAEPHVALTAVADAVMVAAGCVTVDDADLVHPLASVTVTVYVPAGLPVIF